MIYTNNIPSSRFASNNKINLIVISDYKSIALPTELQGQVLINRIFSLISQSNQSIFNCYIGNSCYSSQLL